MLAFGVSERSGLILYRPLAMRELALFLIVERVAQVSCAAYL
jgi:hypothetical protein